MPIWLHRPFMRIWRWKVCWVMKRSKTSSMLTNQVLAKPLEVVQPPLLVCLMISDSCLQGHQMQNIYDLVHDIFRLTLLRVVVQGANDMVTKRWNCNFCLIPMWHARCVMGKDINLRYWISNGVVFPSAKFWICMWMRH